VPPDGPEGGIVEAVVVDLLHEREGRVEIVAELQPPEVAAEGVPDSRTGLRRFEPCRETSPRSKREISVSTSESTPSASGGAARGAYVRVRAVGPEIGDDAELREPSYEGHPLVAMKEEGVIGVHHPAVGRQSARRTKQRAYVARGNGPFRHLGIGITPQEAGMDPPAGDEQCRRPSVARSTGEGSGDRPSGIEDALPAGNRTHWT
jgi:hypothetical protein